MRDRSARQLTANGDAVSDDWKRLGSIVKGIAVRLEVSTARPPLARADADLFVAMLREIYGPAVPPDAELSRQDAQPIEGAE